MTEFYQGRAWIELSRTALRHNVEQLQTLLPPNCALMPAVKANAYGHGAVLIARELNTLGVNAFCVATVFEGIELRQGGVAGEILILGYTHPQYVPLLVQYHLTQTILDYPYALELNACGQIINVHIKLNTGMHRLGENCENLDKIQRMNPLFVGIGVSSKNNVTHLMKPDGSKHSSFSVQNNLGGAKLMSEKIVLAMETMGLNDVVIGLEATSIYGDSLVYALREDRRLGRYQRKLHVLNPKQVRKFKESYPDLPKNDWVDAFVIADHLRFGRIGKEVYMDDYRYKSLQTLTRARFDVVQNLTREKQHFANYLFLKCCGMAQDKDIANSSATTIALMERFETVDELAYADLDELTKFIDETGRNFADPAAKAKAIQTAARNSYRLPITVNNSVNQAMAVSIATMRALGKQIKVLDKAIEQQFEIIPNTLTSIPGIGKVYSAGIIAEIGDIHRFSSQASVAKFAGLVWTQHQSGDFEAQHSKLIKSGNRYLRYYLLEAANSVRRCDSEFRRYYDLKFKEVNQFQHKRALALTARKLVRLVYRLLMDNRLYIPPES